jgi:hypothetical protein
MGLMRFPPAISEYLQEASVSISICTIVLVKQVRIMGLIRVLPAKSEYLVKYLVKRVKKLQKVVN